MDIYVIAAIIFGGAALILAGIILYRVSGEVDADIPIDPHDDITEVNRKVPNVVEPNVVVRKKDKFKRAKTKRVYD